MQAEHGASTQLGGARGGEGTIRGEKKKAPPARRGLHTLSFLPDFSRQEKRSRTRNQEASLDPPPLPAHLTRTRTRAWRSRRGLPATPGFVLTMLTVSEAATAALCLAGSLGSAAAFQSPWVVGRSSASAGREGSGGLQRQRRAAGAAVTVTTPVSR